MARSIPERLGASLHQFIEARADLVLGSRELGGTAVSAILPHQRLGNQLVVALVRWLYGVRVTDVGPFRAMRR